MATLRLWSEEVEALRPEARAVVDAGSAFFPAGGGAAEHLTREERVAQQRASHVQSTITVPEGEERTIAGVRCRVFRPDGAARAVYLHFHGGGMVAGTPEMMDIPNRALARELGVAVVSADYRKAPEQPWPAGPDDGVAVAAWLLEHAGGELGASRLLIGGESAGGYMTAVVALRVRDELRAIERVAGLNLVFGVYDWGRSPSQRGMRPHDGFDVLGPEGIVFVSDCFLPGMTDEERRAPEVSPAFADLRGLPPCLVSVGSCDHLLDDSLLFATRAAAAGVDVDLHVLPEMPHAFQAFPCRLTELWTQHQYAWLRARLDTSE
ncbi:MAG TPA: alpha/beta hydrolase [Acidimicrobiia bacterium]|jgi:acetyl esterase/lipase